jgi:hypothetical protein
VEADVWQTYREVCSREKLRPSRPIEDFLRIVVDSESALGTLNMMREAARSKVDGLQAYAQVLLFYYTHGKFWIHDREDEVSVEFLLLDALKIVADKDLRSQIETALIGQQRSIDAKKKAEESQNEKPT